MSNTNTRKQAKDPFKTRSWVSECLTDPYQVLAHFFAEAPVHEFRRLVKKLVSHAGGAGVHKGASPGDVLLYGRLIRSLIKAAHALKEKHSPVIINGDDLFSGKYYRSHYAGARAWNEFPRHLSEKEYRDPYRVFKKFFRYQVLHQWLHCWEQVVQGALCHDDALAPPAPVELYSHLAKLVEAAHLMDVREVTNVGGCLKGRG